MTSESGRVRARPRTGEGRSGARWRNEGVGRCRQIGWNRGKAPVPMERWVQGAGVFLTEFWRWGMHIQEMILRLQTFWSGRGMCPRSALRCGKGSGNPQSDDLFAVLGPEPWKVAYVEPSRRPADGRYGENPNRVLSAPPISGDYEAFARRYPGVVSG